MQLRYAYIGIAAAVGRRVGADAVTSGQGGLVVRRILNRHLTYAHI